LRDPDRTHLGQQAFRRNLEIDLLHSATQIGDCKQRSRTEVDGYLHPIQLQRKRGLCGWGRNACNSSEPSAENGGKVAWLGEAGLIRS